MLDYSLPPEKIVKLRAAHRSTRDKRQADRIKAVLALAIGWMAKEVAEILQADANPVRNHFKCDREGGINALGHIAFRGSACALDVDQLAILDARLQEYLYLTAKTIAHWVEETFGASYTESSMTALLHRLGYVYKKSKLVPGKADSHAQERFLAEHEKLRQDKGKDDPAYLMDAVHPQHNPVVACGLIKRGEDREVGSNTDRRRVNIKGAIDLDRLESLVCLDDTFNTDSTIILLEKLEELNLAATWIYVACDSARYHRSTAIKEYLKTSRIGLVFLPPYVPNLNLIGRLWKFFKNGVRCNRCLVWFVEFRTACKEVFSNPRKYHRELRSLLTENFAIVGL